MHENVHRNKEHYEMERIKDKGTDELRYEQKIRKLDRQRGKIEKRQREKRKIKRKIVKKLKRKRRRRIKRKKTESNIRGSGRGRVPRKVALGNL